MPVKELLDLRLRGVIIEDASFLMERLLGRLPLDGLNPSALIFTHGFNVKASQQIIRRLVSILVSFIGLVLCLPIIPFSFWLFGSLRRGRSFFGRLGLGSAVVHLRFSSSEP